MGKTSHFTLIDGDSRSFSYLQIFLCSFINVNLLCTQSPRCVIHATLTLNIRLSTDLLSSMQGRLSDCLRS